MGRSLLILAALGLAACGGGGVATVPTAAPASKVVASAPAATATPAAALPATPAVSSAASSATGAAAVASVSGIAPTTPTQTTLLAAVATRASVPVGSSGGHQAVFTAASGQTITVTVAGPTGVTAQTACPGPDCYVMRAINPGETPDVYFPTAVSAAVTLGAHKLVIPSGVYNFVGPTISPDSTNTTTCNEGHYYNCAPHWTIGTYPTGALTTPTSIQDLDIDGSGSTLNFAAPSTGIVIQNVARLRLENFTIDWPTLPIASLGTIVADSTHPGHQALVIDDAYPTTDPLTGTAVQIQAVDPWDDSTDPMLAPGRIDLKATNADETYWIFENAPQPTYVGQTAAGHQTFSCASCNFVNSATDGSCSMFQGCANFDEFTVGQRVLVRHYTYNGYAVLMNWSNDVDLESLHILTAPGMGIGVKNAAGFRGFRVGDSSIKRAAGRLISSASDAINITQFGGDILIENDEIAFQGDDGLNITPQSEPLTWQSATMTGASALITVTGDCSPQPRDGVMAGDALALYSGSSTYLGLATAGTIATPCSDSTALSLTLQSTLNAATATATASGAATLVDVTQQPVARYVVRGTYFHDNRGHGTSTGAPFGNITGNTFAHESMGPTEIGTPDLATGNQVMSGNIFD